MMLIRDVRYVLRTILNRPGFAVVAILTLGIGIGATTAIFSLVNGVLLKPLPYRDPDQLVWIGEKLPGLEGASVAYPNFLDWQEQNTSFAQMAAFRPTTFNLTGLGDPVELMAYQLSASSFAVLGVQPMLGRTFTAAEASPGGPPVVVISHRLWRDRFGGDPGVIGKLMSLDDTSHTVVGVMPRHFVFPPLQPEVTTWLPIEQLADEKWMSRNSNPGIQAMARLAPEVSLEQARVDMEAIAIRLEQEYPSTNTGARVNMVSLFKRVLGDLQRRISLLFCAVLFVLLIACTNVANLILARGAQREPEIAIRTAIGASRTRMLSLQLTESVTLWLLGGLVGLGLAWGGTRAFAVYLPELASLPTAVGIDSRVLLFALGLSLVTGLVFGLVPAVRSTRLNVRECLKAGGATMSGGRNRLRRRLVVAQVTLAYVLLILAGLTLHSLVRLMAASPGINANDLLAVRISLPESRYPELAERHTFFKALRDRVAGQSEVVSAAVVEPLPFGRGGWQSTYCVAGEPALAEGQYQFVETFASSPGYHSTLGIPLLAGRYFSGHDRGDAPPARFLRGAPLAVLVDERLAERHWPGQDPIGQRMKFGSQSGSGRWMEVVGVVGHVKNRGIAEQSLVQVYIPFERDDDDTWYLMVRSPSAPAALAALVRTAVAELDPNQPLSEIATMADLVARTTVSNRVLAALFAAFAAVALVLAAIGIYGVMSCDITERRREIAVRFALGAARQAVFAAVVRQGLALAGAGVAIGFALALGAARLLSSELYGISPVDPLTLLGVALVLGLATVLAAYLPARRASGMDPAEILRSE